MRPGAQPHLVYSDRPAGQVDGNFRHQAKRGNSGTDGTFPTKTRTCFVPDQRLAFSVGRPFGPL